MKKCVKRKRGMLTLRNNVLFRHDWKDFTHSIPELFKVFTYEQLSPSSEPLHSFQNSPTFRKVKEKFDIEAAD